MPIRLSVPGSIIVNDTDGNKGSGHELRSTTKSLNVAIFPEKSGTIAFLDDIDSSVSETKRALFYVTVESIESPEIEVTEFRTEDKFREGDLLIVVEDNRHDESIYTLYSYDSRPKNEEDIPYQIRAANGVGMWKAIAGRFIGQDVSTKKPHIFINGIKIGEEGKETSLTATSTEPRNIEFPDRSGTVTLEELSGIPAGENLVKGNVVFLDSDITIKKWDATSTPNKIIVGVMRRDSNIGEDTLIVNSGFIEGIGPGNPGEKLFAGNSGSLISDPSGLSVIVEMGTDLGSNVEINIKRTIHVQ